MKTVTAALSALALAACHASAPEAPSGVKPRHVACDPAAPERPCTPEPGLEPAGADTGDVEAGELGAADAPTLEPETPPGVKPRRVACDPSRPELPCTPEPAAPKTP
jgi:hypothetical protein